MHRVCSDNAKDVQEIFFSGKPPTWMGKAFASIWNIVGLLGFELHRREYETGLQSIVLV